MEGVQQPGGYIPNNSVEAERMLEAHQDGLLQAAALHAGEEEGLDDLLVELRAQRRQPVELHLCSSPPEIACLTFEASHSRTVR